METVKQLMSVILYEFSGNELGKLKLDYKKYTFRHIPEFTLRADGRIIESEYYLQFIEIGEEKYLLFDIIHMDGLLKEEVSYEGYDALRSVDLKPVFDKLSKYTYDDYNRTISIEHHLVFDYIVRGRGEDTEIEIKFDKILEL